MPGRALSRFGGKCAMRSVRFALAHFADVVLGVELEPELGDEIELGFEEIDVDNRRRSKLRP